MWILLKFKPFCLHSSKKKIKAGRSIPIDGYMPDVASCLRIRQRYSLIE